MFLTKYLEKIGLYWPLRRLHRRFTKGVRPTNKIFTEIYALNQWGSVESVSGVGSSLLQTKVISSELPLVLQELNIRSLLDLPCGDFNWMSRVDLNGVQYLGADIVEELVERNNNMYRNKERNFIVLDLIRDPLPKVDLVFCRDCLVHLCFEDIRTSIENIRRSGARYLMTTTFMNTSKNHEIETGDFRPLNLQRPPFDFPMPHRVFVEHCTEGGGTFADKAMAVWLVESLPSWPSAHLT